MKKCKSFAKVAKNKHIMNSKWQDLLQRPLNACVVLLRGSSAGDDMMVLLYVAAGHHICNIIYKAKTRFIQVS